METEPKPELKPEKNLMFLLFVEDALDGKGSEKIAIIIGKGKNTVRCG